MINESSGIEMFIDAEGMNILKNPIITVFGVGGVGSHAAKALARYGVGRLILVDNDMVSLTNINRQSIALHSIIGQFKTRVTKEEIADICPGTRVITFEESVLPNDVESLFEHMELQTGQGNSADYILDATDIVTAKPALIGFAISCGISVIVSMGTGNKLHPELLRTSDISWTSVCLFCKVMHKELKARNISGLKVCWSSKQPLTPGQMAEDTGHCRVTPGSIFLVSSVAGLVIAGVVIRDICGLE